MQKEFRPPRRVMLFNTNMLAGLFLQKDNWPLEQKVDALFLFYRRINFNHRKIHAAV